MRTKHLVLLGVIIMQVCFVQALHYDLTTLLDQQSEVDCENTDFVQMLQDFDSWSEIIELLQQGQLDAEMRQLQELSDYTNEMISANPNDLMEDQQYDEQLEQMDEQLQTIQNQYNGPQRKFLFEQSRQISDQIRRVIESRSFEQKRSQLAMLYGLIEYLLKQISRVQNQYYNQDYSIITIINNITITIIKITITITLNIIKNQRIKGENYCYKRQMW